MQRNGVIHIPTKSESAQVSISSHGGEIRPERREHYDRHQDRSNPLPYRVIGECKRFSIPSWKKYAHPPCFDYSRIDTTTCCFGSPYFANRIELLRPTTEYHITPPRIRLPPVELSLAPSMPYYRFPPDCINWSIARRMPIETLWCPSVNGIGWLLLEQFGMAYGIQVDYKNHQESDWHFWIDAKLPYGWAAIAWDYIAEASG